MILKKLFVLRATACYFIFWLGYFILFRGIFLLYHYSLSSRLDAELILGTFYYGLKMDISFSSYLTLLVLVALGLSPLFTSGTSGKVITVITTFFLILISIISIADLELFKEWGFRFDATPLMYLNTPKAMAASISSSPYLMLFAAIVITCITGLKVYRKFVLPQFNMIGKPALLQSLIYLFCAGLLVIPIRGGFQLAPMNQSVAFFSNSDFANQAAINVPWNFFWSLSKQLYSRKNPYQFMPEEEADKLLKIYYQNDSINTSYLLKSVKPNVVIILWESLTYNVVPAIGGSYQGVVPEFESLKREGILFSNFYANGNRSDKGIVAVLSGYPAQPKRSIVKIPTKSSKLPVIIRPLMDHGYYTGYFHGGELEFANIKSYLINAEFNSLVGKNAFQKGQMNSKWGAHDHVVLEKALKDISRQPAPFFNMIFTLSSHEPFDIPVPPRFPGGDLESLYKSSLHYTDQAIGTFIKQAKKEPWYENALIIILADHGHRLLGDSPRYERSRFHIPMLWLGGALKVQDIVISKTCSQTDIASTLLNQLKMDASQFVWSRDIFNQFTPSGSFYVYDEGVAYVDGSDQVIYDFPSNELISRTRSITDKEVELCKAHLQLSYQDYLNK